MTRAMTPIIYYINPKVVYDGADVSFYVDPRSAQSYKISTENFFTDARINLQLVDFMSFVDTSTTITGYTKNQVRGIVRQAFTSVNAPVTFKYRAGSSQEDDSQMPLCQVNG